MATNIKPLLSHENGTELCRVREEGAVKGFKKECLKEDLTERDRTLLTCSRCQGILREACNSNSGEQFCLCCKKEQEQTHPNLQVRNTVLLLKSLCPIHQRGCNWVGNLGDCEKHLEVCGYVHEKCKLGCGVVLSRDELRIHSKEECSQRIVVCEYCEEKFKHCDLLTHHSKCKKILVPCELGCDKLVIRENMTQHMDIECGEKEVNCPFVQYGCKVGLIKRKEMNQHLEDKKIEHMEIKMNSLEETVVEQKETISQLSEKVDTLTQLSEKVDTLTQLSEKVDTLTQLSEKVDTLTQLSEKVDTLTKLSEKADTLTQLSEKVDTLTQISEKIDSVFDPEKYNVVFWNVEGITYRMERNIDHTFTSEEYMLCGLPMSFILTVSKNLTIKFRLSNRRRTVFPLNHRGGYFITRLVCHNDHRNTLEFKSRDYLIGQPASLTHIIMLYTEGEIATIERDCIAARFIRDGGIELGITFERS